MLDLLLAGMVAVVSILALGAAVSGSHFATVCAAHVTLASQNNGWLHVTTVMGGFHRFFAVTPIIRIPKMVMPAFLVVLEMRLGCLGLW